MNAEKFITDLKAQDLRIGNYINLDYPIQKESKLIKVSAYHIKDILHCEIANVKSNYIRIPLTEEWLLKFGFEKKKVPGSTNKFYFIKNKFYYCIHDFNPVVYSNKSLEGVFLEHVHQLQNLYHSLTGEELNIKH